ncbi:MAG: hypothetical protein FJ202_13645, partial [Gemmatimonadetes bacterium]|nr:hypothetical protein [Gemmatimonadota bacterium]
MTNDGRFVLGIHDGHNASACLVRDGEVVAAVAEERISRNKNEPGYPRRAIDWVLAQGGLRGDALAAVALGTCFMHHREFYLSWDWYRKGYQDQLAESEEEWQRRHHFLEERQNERRRAIVDHLGVPADRIHIVEHHMGHAATAYYGSPWAGDGQPVLVLTLDGSGDGLCATVNVAREGRIERLAATPSRASIGKVYSRITYLLGMRPWEHEYKVMGLAPYADEHGAERSGKVIRPLVRLAPDGLTFEPGTELGANYCYGYLRTHLENHRFDWIAGAAQRVTEELLVDWVRNAVRATGIHRIACAGGVFMNIKANLLIHELAEVDELYVFPSCGDESLCFGAAWQVSAAAPRPLQSAYLGPAFVETDITSAIQATGAANRHRIRRAADVNGEIASLLAEGAIVARFAGAMEWGARALGNRSILMDPRRTDKVRELNAAIKHRDFWMPFAPSLVAERHHDYVVNPKQLPSPHMLLGYRTTPLAQTELPAALHPYDHTARPQIVRRDDNPEYHD